MAGICTSPYPSPYPTEKVGDSPYPYPYPVNAGIPRQNGDGFGQYPRGRVYLPSLFVHYIQILSMGKIIFFSVRYWLIIYSIVDRFNWRKGWEKYYEHRCCDKWNKNSISGRKFRNMHKVYINLWEVFYDDIKFYKNIWLRILLGLCISLLLRSVNLSLTKTYYISL